MRVLEPVARAASRTSSRLCVCAGLAILLGCATPTPRARVVPASELSWGDIRKPDGSPLGARTTDLWGHAATGPHGSLTTFPAGLAEPLHHHSHDIRAVVVSGVMRYVIDGVKSRDLEVGSYVFVGANVPHYAQCNEAAPCEVIIMQDGPMDVKVEAPR